MGFRAGRSPRSRRRSVRDRPLAAKRRPRRRSSVAGRAPRGSRMLRYARSAARRPRHTGRLRDARCSRGLARWRHGSPRASARGCQASADRCGIHRLRLGAPARLRAGRERARSLPFRALSQGRHRRTDPDPTWTVGFIKIGDINSLFARVRVLPSLHFRSVGSAVRGRGFSLRGVR